MSAPITLGAMLNSVRLRANLENQTGFIADAEIYEHLNYGIGELYDLLIAARAQEYYRNSISFNTTANQAFYSFSSIGITDFYQLVSLDVQLGTNITISARPYMEAERNRFKWYPGWFYNMPVYYRILGGAVTSGSPAGGSSANSGISFIPAPSGAFNVTVNYYPVFTPFATNGSASSSTFDGINGWEEYAIWRATAACKAKGDEDPAFALSMLASMKERIQGLAASHDGGNAERVHDVTADYDPFGVD